MKNIVILDLYSPGSFGIYMGRDPVTHFLNYDQYFDSRTNSSDLT